MKMPRTEVHVRHVVLQAQAEVALPVGEEVDRAGGREPRRDPSRFLDVDAAFHPFVRRHLEPDDEALTAGVADALGNFAHESGPAFEVTTVGVLTRVGPRREELRDEIAVRPVQLHPVEPAIREPPRRRHVGIDHTGALLGRHHPWHRPAQRIGLVGDPGRRARRMPELLAARMPELAEDAGAGRMHFVRHPAESRVVCVVVPGDDGTVRERLRVHRDDLGHDEPASAPRALGEKVDPPLRDAVPGSEVGQGGGKGDAVAQRPRPDLQRREQVWVGGVSWIHAASPGDGQAAETPFRHEA